MVSPLFTRSSDVMRKRIIALAIVIIAGLAGGFAPLRLSGQQQNIRKQPACTMFCGDGTFNTFSLGAKPCWGGPLPANTAGDHFNGLAPEDQAAICRSLASGNPNASCPAVKTLLALCKPESLPKDEGPKPTCKERGPDDVPWFDPGSPSGCEKLQNTRMSANWSSEGGGTCTLRLTACNYTVLTMPVRFVSPGALRFKSYPGHTAPMPGYRRITRAECTPQLYDTLIGDYPNTVCCDAWNEGVSARSGCNPETDADCDGLPNDRDGYLNVEPFYAPPRPGSLRDQLSDGASAFDPANFDPRPPGLSWDELMPNEPCKKCKWTATSGKLTCSPDGRAEHEYKATWVCPSSGVIRTVTKRAPASAPCTAPQSPTP
jgi:hypothetical protein